MSILSVLFSRITARPPSREITDRFWNWIEEQIDKIRTELIGRNQLIYGYFTTIGNPAAAGEQLIHEVTINAGLFDGLLTDKLTIFVFGKLANNGNTKTIKLKFNGVAIVTMATIAADVFFRGILEVFITGNAAQKCAGKIEVSGVATTFGYGTDTVNVSVGDLEIQITGQSSASAANDIVVEGITVETARVTRQ